MPEPRKISPIHVIPAALSSALGGVGGWLLWLSGIGEDIEGPFSKGSSASDLAYNILLFLGLVVIGTSIALLIIKYRKNMLKLLFISSILLSATGIYYVYICAVAFIARLPISDAEALVTSLALSVLTAVIVGTSSREIAIATVLLVFGSCAGAVLSYALSPISVWAIAAAMSIYDIYSVFKGPLRRMIESSGFKPGCQEGSRISDVFRGAVVPFKGINLGMGDVIFYSMVTAAALIYPQPPAPLRAVAVALALCTGNYLTLKMLTKKPVLPALPLPMSLAVVAYILFMVI